MSQQFPPASAVDTVTSGNKKRNERRSDYKSPFDSSESDADDNGSSAKIESMDRAAAQNNNSSNNNNNATTVAHTSNNATTVAHTSNNATTNRAVA
jgi:hypothetical protein